MSEGEIDRERERGGGGRERDKEWSGGEEEKVEGKED